MKNNETNNLGSKSESFTVAPSFNTRPSSSNLSAMTNEMNLFDLDALFADDFFPPEIDFSQFFEQQEKFLQNSNIPAIIDEVSPPTQNQPNMERATRDATYTDIASHASDVYDIIMIPPVMPRQLPSLKRSSEEDDFGSHKRRPSIKVKEEDKDTLNATSSVASTNPSSGYGTGFRFNNQSDSQELTESQKIERRERNREHAKKSRIRKRLLLDTLSDQLEALRAENVKLRALVREKLNPRTAQKVITECTIEESQLLADCDDSGGGKGRNNLVKLSSGFPGVTSSFSAGGPTSSLIASSGGIKVSQLPSAFQSLQRSKSVVSRVLMEPDYRLIESITIAQQNFCLTDPSLPDNPIVYVSEGFCKLTGYRREQVVGRNCRFLQGEGTDQCAVDIIRKGIEEGRDVSVCLLNYKASGAPFWNQFFVSALRDSFGHVVNYVGIQCEVNLLAVSELRERVKKLPIPTEAFTGQNSHFSAPSIGYHSRTTSLQPHHYQNTPAVPPSLPQKALPAPSSLPTVTSQKPVILPPNISSTANSSTSNAPSHSQL
eukprot:gene28715-37707_t